MADIEIDFHASTDEIAKWVTEWVQCEGIHLVAMRFHPFGAREVQARDVSEVVTNDDIERVCFLISRPNLEVRSEVDFEDAHSEQLVLDIGRLSDDGLAESGLACRTDVAKALAVWRRIAKSLKAMTKAGVTGINRQNGRTAYYPSHRYTEGAEALEATGTPMLPTTGLRGPLLRLGKTAGPGSTDHFPQ
ncbi:MAG: hypothetical protein HQ567_11270 [Candidatus Nealsonbacteria bacterium]|nr:hypothetical protein [Candidatus Nealsonbacteria bacterium]